VHPQEEGGLRADRPLIVGGACAVGRADLDELRVGGGEDFGDAKVVVSM